MSIRPYAAALLACLMLLPAAPAAAIDGEVLITHAKALAGNVTPGDAAGYPVTISTPGRFKLAGNLFVPATKVGIQVTSKNVTIDLNGFTMQGSNVAHHGITGGVDSVTIKNGTIDSFKFYGIWGTGAYWIVESMRVVRNGSTGIVSYGSIGFSVRGSTVAENGHDGVSCSLRCLVEGNNISGNGADGIYIISGLVLGNTIIGNSLFGLQGGDVGYGNNTLVSNGNPVSAGPIQLHPNACVPAC
jgi:parallel beta-helix repeat protein